MLIAQNTRAVPRGEAAGADVGKTISMRQALAHLAQRRPLAKPLPKRRGA